MRNALTVLVLSLLVLATFFRAADYDFVTFDDAAHIYHNENHRPVTQKSFERYWSRPFQGLFIPVTYSFWALQTKLDPRFNPKIYHWANICVHLLNVLLVFGLLLKLVLSRSAAFWGAFLFALHPLQVESVAWISAMKDLLAGFFSLACIFVYFQKFRGSYWVSLGLFGLALLSKPVAVCVPIIVAAMDWAINARPLREVGKKFVPWLILVGPLLWLTKEQQPDGVIEYIVPLKYRFVVASDAILFYLRQTIFPFFLTLNYGRTPEWLLGTRWVWASIPVLVLLLGLLYFRKHRTVWVTATVIFIANILPTSGLINFYYQKYSTVADRFAYLSLLGPALLLAWYLSKIQSQWGRAVLLGALFMLPAKTLLQLGVWRSNLSLVSHMTTLNSTADNHTNLGSMLALYMDGQNPVPGTLSRPRVAIEDPDTRRRLNKRIFHHLFEAVRLNPRGWEAYHYLGQRYAALERWGEAEKMYVQAMRFKKDSPELHNDFGISLAEQGQFAEAIALFEKALVLKKDFTNARSNLALAGKLQKRNE